MIAPYYYLLLIFKLTLLYTLIYMKALNRILLLFIIVIVSGCSSASSDSAPQTFNAASDKGLAIGTITFEGDTPVNDIYRFFYMANVGDKKFMKRNAGKIIINGRANKEGGFNGDFNNKKTYLYVIEREPGAYAFTQYNYLDHLGSHGMVTSSKTFAIPFEIKKGEITYIGEMAYKDVAEKGTPRIFVADYLARDLPEFKTKYPNIKWDKVVNATPKQGDNGGGVVDFR